MLRDTNNIQHPEEEKFHFRMCTENNWKRSEKIWWRRWYLRCAIWTFGDMVEGHSWWKEQHERKHKGKKMWDLCGQQCGWLGAWCRDSVSPRPGFSLCLSSASLAWICFQIGYRCCIPSGSCPAMRSVCVCLSIPRKWLIGLTGPNTLSEIVLWPWEWDLLISSRPWLHACKINHQENRQECSWPLLVWHCLMGIDFCSNDSKKKKKERK